MQNTTPEMVRYEEVNNGRIAVITLDRPEARNAQNKQMTYELNDAFTRAANADSVKCIVLAANGPHFSAGHDLKGPGEYDAEPVWVGGSYERGGAEGAMAYEKRCTCTCAGDDLALHRRRFDADVGVRRDHCV